MKGKIEEGVKICSSNGDGVRSKNDQTGKGEREKYKGILRKMNWKMGGAGHSEGRMG